MRCRMRCLNVSMYVRLKDVFRRRRSNSLVWSSVVWDWKKLEFFQESHTKYRLSILAELNSKGHEVWSLLTRICCSCMVPVGGQRVKQPWRNLNPDKAGHPFPQAGWSSCADRERNNRLRFSLSSDCSVETLDWFTPRHSGYYIITERF
jgi:hypothetical protein